MTERAVSVTDDEIEAMARAFYVAFSEESNWNEMPNEIKQDYRDGIRAALAHHIRHEFEQQAASVRGLTKCPHCDIAPAPCPICGKPGKIFGENNVGCSNWQCGTQMDWGHWCGEDDDGVPAVHFVIAAWNRRRGRRAAIYDALREPTLEMLKQATK